MASTAPLSGVVTYDENDQALGGEQMGTIVTQLDPLLNLRFATTGARDQAFASWVAAGNTIPTGASVFVGTRQYVYNGGWQAVSGYLGSGTAYPATAIDGDTYYRTDFRCAMRLRAGVWRQADIAQVFSDSDRSTYTSALNSAGLAFHDGFQVMQTDTDVLFTGTGIGVNLQRVASPGFLKQATGADKPVGTTSTTVASVTVTVPDALPSNRRIKVTGTGTASCPTGVGVVVVVGSTSRSINASIQGDVTAVYYDSDLSAGTRTYALQAHSTVAGQNVTIWQPTIAVEII